MAFKYSSRVRQTSTTTGTGAITLTAGSNPVTFRRFRDVLSNGDKHPYLVVNRNANEWEEGRGTLTVATPDSFTRDTVLDGTSGAGTLVNFSAGVKDIWLGAPANLLQYRNGVLAANAVPYINADGVLDQDTSLTWDSVNKRLLTPKVIGAASGGGLGFTLGTGAGPNAGAAVSGTDLAGFISVTTNAADTPAANADIITITFGTAYGAQPHVIVQAASDTAIQLAYPTFVCRKQDMLTTQFKLRSSTNPLPALTAATYTWTFMVIQ